MMEDRRNASEELFGELFDFSAGPTQGDEGDRLRSAIEWMRDEFLTRLEDYLTPGQLSAWSLHLETTGLPASLAPPQASPQEQTQYVRINTNDFTAEEPSYRFGRRRTEIIERGGAGAFHGRVQFLVKDESLNASRRSYSRGLRRPTVKPPYQERQTSFDLSGPLIPGRLTIRFAGSQNEAENVTTVDATLADGTPFSSEVVRPTTRRSLRTGGTYQLGDSHSLTYDIGYSPYSLENQGIGGFTLPERAWTTDGNSWDIELKQFSSLSPTSIYETRFKISSGHEEVVPENDGLQINVPGAFRSGGSQNSSETDSRDYEFGNLYTRVGEDLTLRVGVDGRYQKNRSFSTANFDGTFTFSSLDDFNQGRLFEYRVARGEPLLETSQTELSFFMQNDWSLTPELTFYFGVRYDWQTNLDDDDNIAPRLGFAYALGQATVIRGGGGVFYFRFPMNLVETQRRLDGTHQHEIVIRDSSYPDPFQSGSVLLPSVRVTDPTASAPYVEAGVISIERTFLTNLFVSAGYEYTHEVHRLRLRNLNAPFDITAPVVQSCTQDQPLEICLRPDPTKGEILSLGGVAAEVHNTFRLTYRQRFSVFNVSANYQYLRAHADGAPNARLILAADSYNLRAEWGNAPFPTNTLSSTVNAQLPLGVFLTGTMSANSGRFYNITTGTDDNKDGYLTDRPEGVKRNSGRRARIPQFRLQYFKGVFL